METKNMEDHRELPNKENHQNIETPLNKSEVNRDSSTVIKEAISSLEKDIETLESSKRKLGKNREIKALREKLKEIREIELDRKEKAFAYYAMEKSANPLILNLNTNKEIGLIDLRGKGKNWIEVKTEEVELINNNEGFCEYNIFGFVKVIENLNTITSDNGSVDIGSEMAYYRIIGPNGEIIASGIKGYPKAEEIYIEKTKEYAEKIKKEFEEQLKKESGEEKTEDKTMKKEKPTTEEFNIATKIAEVFADLAKGLGEEAAKKLQGYASEIKSNPDKKDFILQGLPDVWVKGVYDILKAEGYEIDVPEEKEKVEISTDKDSGLEIFTNKISALLSSAIENNLGEDAELKKYVTDSLQTLIKNFEKDYDSLNEKEEEGRIAELTALCNDKNLFIERMKEFQTENQQESTNIDTTMNNKDADPIGKRAHEIYEERMRDGIDGDEKTDWEQAEKEIMGEKNDIEMKEGELSPEKIANLEELLGKLEGEAKDKLENGPLSSKMKGLVLNGLNKWENYGKGEEGVKGFAKRFSKMAVNLALIGAISSISVQGLAQSGIGTATALSGGVTSYIGRKMAIGLGIGGIIEMAGNKIPDKVKKWMPVAMGVIGAGTAFALTGGAAGIVAGLSAGIGYVGSKYIGSKYTNEAILKKEDFAKQEFLLLLKEREKNGELDFNKIDQIKTDYEKILKKYENQRTWGKLLAGAKKLGVGSLISGISMEVSGLTHDNSIHNQQTEIDGVTGPDINHDTIDRIVPPTMSPYQHVSVEAISDNGQGAISTLRELQDNLKAEYGDNLADAPESVKHILNTDAHKLAQEYGMYKPGEDAESAFIKSGAVFKVDENGNLTYQEAGSDKSIILQSGNPNISEVDYSGKMSDTDHSGLEIKHTINTTPEQIQTTDTTLYDKNNLDPLESKTIEKVESNNTNKSNIYINKQMIIGPSGNELIQTAPLAGLSQIDLEQIFATFQNNINHLFPTEELRDAWDLVKTRVPAVELMSTHENGRLEPEYLPLVNHIKQLEELTGFKPIPESSIPPVAAESITHFINRAMEQLQFDYRLDEVRL